MEFSVLLLYPDYLADTFGQETYFTHVASESVEAGVRAAQEEAAECQQCECDPVDFFPLLVVQGWHADLAVAS